MSVLDTRSSSDAAALELFSAPTRAWFQGAFEEPTRVQLAGWPLLASGRHALLVAPTGSGKTLAAFLWSIDRLSREDPAAEEGVRVLYVSPLKALVYDIERNLRAPLVGIQHAAERLGENVRRSRVDVRTGDTPARDRRRFQRQPGDILVTTPESLFLILGSRAAEALNTVHTVIVDEVHALAPTKRGVHLALSLERLAERCSAEPQRIGLSATVEPMEGAARFLGGDRPVEVVDAREAAHVALEVLVPVPDMENPPPPERAEEPRRGGSILGELAAAERRSSGWRGSEVSGVWPAIYPRLLELVQAHRSTIIFTNSRGQCERLGQRLNELAGEELVRAHHGSISHATRNEIEEALKAGTLRGIVATSSLELGVDMGAVDLVVLVESPGSVSRGLQRVGRAGHSVGEISRGVMVPKFRGDLLECAVVAEGMKAGTLEPIRGPQNALDVLAQQVVALCCDRPRPVEEIHAVVRRAAPYAELSLDALVSVLDMLSGRYPSNELADLRPRLSWDRSTNVLTARPGARMLTLMNAGTIPDRGLYAVHLGADGPRVGELDEEMVYETRQGDTFFLGASTWRVLEITRDRVFVEPAPGEPGRMPFWRGAGPGRPIELGRAMGAFLRRLTELDDEGAARFLAEHTPLDENAVRNLLTYVRQQQGHTDGALPTDRAITVERFRDELGDMRVCILTPFGSRVHGPWAMALGARLSQRGGFEVQTMYTDDGIVLRFADSEEMPSLDELLPDPEEVEELVVEQVGSSALFASTFRENAARALLLPRRRPHKRTALWQQRLRAQGLLAVVRQFPTFPIVLETYRQCLRDVFDLPALVDLLGAIRRREIRVDDVETPSPSPFARSLVFAYVANYLYEQDSPLAERRAQALTLDRGLLRELLGSAELRELLDERVVEEVEAELQGLAEDWQARSADELHDLLRRIGDLSAAEASLRALVDAGHDSTTWLESLRTQRRVVATQVAGERRFIAVEDGARYRDALGVALPPGLPDGLMVEVESPLEELVRRYARSHGPFLTTDVARRFGLLPSQVEPILRALETEGRLIRGDIRPGGKEPEWCDREVLRRLKRRTLAQLRDEVAPVDGAALGRFLPRWQGVESQQSGGGAARLEEVLVQLEGLPLPWSVLHRHVLPARVKGFTLEQLDLLAASGRLVWVGCGSLGQKDGRIALYRRERVHLLLSELEPYEPPSPHHALVLEHLEARGACFTVELERLAPGVSSRELETVLWDLVWAGRITNDTFLPLRALGGSRRRSSPRPAAVRGTRHAPLGAPGRRMETLAGGRWSLVAALAEPGRRSTEHLLSVATTLLERYGVLSREAALGEEVTGGFAALYPVLREMEETGRVRRGHFVDGLAGGQFALPGAVERLRDVRSEEHAAPRVEILPAVDPANAWGALLPWPETSREDGPRPRRVAGAWVILSAGRPILFLDAGGRSLVTFAALDDEAEPEVVAAALTTIPGRWRRRTLVLEKIDGDPALDSPRAAWLEAAGFAAEYRGLRYSI